MGIEQFFTKYREGFAFTTAFRLMLVAPEGYSRLDLYRDWDEVVLELSHQRDPIGRTAALQAAVGACQHELMEGNVLACCLQEEEPWGKWIVVRALVQLEMVCPEAVAPLIQACVGLRARLLGNEFPANVLEDVLGHALGRLFDLSLEIPSRQAALYVLFRGAAKFSPNFGGRLGDYARAIKDGKVPPNSETDARFEYLRRQFEAESTMRGDRGEQIRSDVPLSWLARLRVWFGGTPDRTPWGRIACMTAVASLVAVSCVLVALFFVHRDEIQAFQDEYIKDIRNSLK